jgi:cGMP-dependent protein kinase
MVCDDGYPKIIDFGAAKFVSGRTYTIIGTPHYMAPEVLTGRGYSHHVDIWSLGIMLYEFICGGCPFGEKDTDTFKVYAKVLKQKLAFPQFLGPNFPAKSLIQQMLSRKPSERGTPKTIMNGSQWFRGFDWDALISKTYKPKYRPDVEPIDIGSASNEPVESHFAQDESGYEIKPAKAAPPLNWDDQF